MIVQLYTCFDENCMIDTYDQNDTVATVRVPRRPWTRPGGRKRRGTSYRFGPSSTDDCCEVNERRLYSMNM